LIVILGLIIVVAAAIVGVARVAGNGGSAHGLAHGFSVLGYHLTGFSGALPLTRMRGEVCVHVGTTGDGPPRPDLTVRSPGRHLSAEQRRPARPRPALICRCKAFETLLADLATICLNQIQPAGPGDAQLPARHHPTPIQRQALGLLASATATGSRSQQPSPTSEDPR
jgi:hypothetical protein